MTDLSILMINHDVVRLDVPMHYTLGMTEVECLIIVVHGEESKPVPFPKHTKVVP